VCARQHPLTSSLQKPRAPPIARRRRFAAAPSPRSPNHPNQNPINPKPKQRLTIYPAYIDALKTVAEGRRIPRDKACPNPHVLEMRDAATHLGLKCEAEDKAYPRDWLVRGRLRVELFDGNDKSTPFNPEITTRRDLLLRLADLVKRHPSQIEKAARKAAKAAGTSQKGQQLTSSKEQGAKRKRGTVKACHVPILEEIAAAQQAMPTGPGGGEAGPSGSGGGAGGAGGGGGGGGGAGGGGAAKKSAKKSAKKK
jgi:signal recognition particle subunit SRP19